MNKPAQAMFGTSDTANPAPAQNPEAKELSLVGKVELRIALADSDSKIESLLQTYLPPLLLKLASDHSSVRNKVSLPKQYDALKESNAYSLLAGHDGVLTYFDLSWQLITYSFG